MRVTFRFGPNYDQRTYGNDKVEEIVNMLINAEARDIFRLLVSLIIDLNYYNDQSKWLSAAEKSIKPYVNRRESKGTIVKMIRTLSALQDQFGDFTGEYIAVIPPKYILQRFEWEYGVPGMNDVLVYIERRRRRRTTSWYSGSRSGSQSIDAAIWSDEKQSGACYECKLMEAIKQDQLDLLGEISSESQERIEIGLASFTSEAALNKCLLKFRKPTNLKILARESLYRHWRP